MNRRQQTDQSIEIFNEPVFDQATQQEIKTRCGLTDEHLNELEFGVQIWKSNREVIQTQPKRSEATKRLNRLIARAVALKKAADSWNELAEGSLYSSPAIGNDLQQLIDFADEQKKIGFVSAAGGRPSSYPEDLAVLVKRVLTIANRRIDYSENGDYRWLLQVVLRAVGFKDGYDDKQIALDWKKGKEFISIRSELLTEAQVPNLLGNRLV